MSDQKPVPTRHPKRSVWGRCEKWVTRIALRVSNGELVVWSYKANPDESGLMPKANFTYEK